MSETSLVAILQRERDALELALRGREPRDALSAVRDFLDRLPAAYAVDTAIDGDARVRDAVEAVRAGVAATDAVELVRPVPPRPPEPPPRRAAGFARWRRVPGETADAFRAGLSGGEPGDAPDHQLSPEPHLEVDAVRLLDALEEALEAADRALEADPEPIPVSPAAKEWSADDALVDLLHDLLSARIRGNTTELLHRLALLEQELRLRHDITTITFDGANDELFEFLTHPDPSEKDPTTRRPALVSGTRLIRRGEVRVPAQALGRPHGRQETWPELPTP